ncbi:hypothetical protein JCM1840_001519 [Sporobolomyces johnsonii]
MAAIRATALVHTARQGPSKPSSLSSPAPFRRLQSASAPNPSKWITLRESRKEQPLDHPLQPSESRAGRITLPKPPFHEVKNIAVFAHPSFRRTHTWRFEAPESELTGRRRKQLMNYERHENFGKDLLQLVVTELATEKYPALRPPAISAIVQTLIGNSELASLSQHYSLPSLLRVDPIAKDVFAADPSVHASLFRAYAAGIYFQEGQRFARQWLRQCFRSILTAEYETIKAALFGEQAEFKTSPIREDEMPLAQFERWMGTVGIKAAWMYSVKGKPPKQVFKAEVRWSGQRAYGSGPTKLIARQNAAAAAIGMRDLPLTPTPIRTVQEARAAHEARTALETRTAQEVSDWTPKLYAFCREHKLSIPQFFTELDGKEPNYKCRVVVEGRNFEGKASLAAMEALSMEEEYRAKTQSTPPAAETSEKAVEEVTA